VATSESSFQRLLGVFSLSLSLFLRPPAFAHPAYTESLPVLHVVRDVRTFTIAPVQLNSAHDCIRTLNSQIYEGVPRSYRTELITK
jgi:hypothetical protein